MGRWPKPGSAGLEWCRVCVRCEYGCSLLIAGPYICVLFLVNTCASDVHPVFNHVAHYGYLLHNMYLLIADIANPDSFM